jgi:hypothetical protein
MVRKGKRCSNSTSTLQGTPVNVFAMMIGKATIEKRSGDNMRLRDRCGRRKYTLEACMCGLDTSWSADMVIK